MSRYRPNPNFTREMQVETAPHVRKVTRRAMDRAIARAPVDSGSYRRSIRVLDETIGATLYTDDWAGHIIEWGTSRQRAHRTLTNAAIDTADRVDIE